jgi:hypothetical protein
MRDSTDAGISTKKNLRESSQFFKMSMFAEKKKRNWRNDCDSCDMSLSYACVSIKIYRHFQVDGFSQRK